MSISFTTAVVVTANTVTAVLSTVLLMLVLWQAPHRRSNRLFALVMFILALYSGVNGLARFIDPLGLDPEPVFYFAVTLYGLFVVSLFFFAAEFSRSRTPTTRIMQITGVVLFVIQAVALWSDHVTTNIRPVPSHDGGYTWDYTPIGLFTSITLVAYLLASAIALYRVPHERAKGLWRAPALVIGSPLAAAFVWPYVPIPLSALFLAAAAAVLGQQVLSHELFNPLREAHEQLAQRHAELREANRMKTQFLTSVSHELRTPLNSIIGYTELVLSGTYGPLNETQENRLEKVVRNGQNLLNLINDVLDLNRIEAGHVALNPRTLSTPDLLETALAAVEPQAAIKQLEIVRDFADAPPLYADELRARQIVTNVLANAVKFTHEGQITLRAFAHEGQIRIEVSDTGIGISPDQAEAVFAEFQQADNSTTRRYEGTGLGMAITKRLVELHGGAIWFESTPGEGTTFFLTLPAAPEPAVEGGRVEAVSNGAACVLVIDDSLEARELLADTLAGAGYTVRTAGSGAEGLAVARSLQPDAITLDVMMPGQDGWATLRQLKDMPETRHIPVIMVSIVDNHPLALTLGAHDTLTKPIALNSLLTTLEHTLAEPRPEAPVLVVDDSPDDRQLLAESLTRAGYTVEAVAGGAAALDWLAAHVPRLVLLDWVMPEVSGFDVLAAIRRDARLAHLPVIVITGKDLTPAEQALLRDRCAELVRKGYGGKALLLEAVQSAIAGAEPAIEG